MLSALEFYMVIFFSSSDFVRLDLLKQCELSLCQPATSISRDRELACGDLNDGLGESNSGSMATQWAGKAVNTV